MSPQRILKASWWQSHGAAVLGAYVVAAVSLLLLLGVVNPKANEGVHSAQQSKVEAVKADRATCQRGNGSRGELRDLLLSLMVPPSNEKGPGASYWKQHPDEYAQVVAATQESQGKVKAALAPRDCAKLFPLP